MPEYDLPPCLNILVSVFWSVAVLLYSISDVSMTRKIFQLFTILNSWSSSTYPKMGILYEVEIIEMNWCYELQTAIKDCTFQTKSINKIRLISHCLKPWTLSKKSCNFTLIKWKSSDYTLSFQSKVLLSGGRPHAPPATTSSGSINN